MAEKYLENGSIEVSDMEKITEHQAILEKLDRVIMLLEVLAGDVTECRLPKVDWDTVDERLKVRKGRE